MSDESPAVAEVKRKFTPSNAMAFGAAGGVGLGPVVIWLLSAMLEQEVPPEVAASIGAVIGNFVGYFFEGGRKS